MADPDSLCYIVHLSSELKVHVFQSVPNYRTAIALRLTCRDLNGIYVEHRNAIQKCLRDRIIDPIEDFYRFLTTLHIPASALKYPPPDGWANITYQNCRVLAKSRFTIEVLKHLPYIEKRPFTHDWDNFHNIDTASNVVDYSECTPADFASPNIKLGEFYDYDSEGEHDDSAHEFYYTDTDEESQESDDEGSQTADGDKTAVLDSENASNLNGDNTDGSDEEGSEEHDSGDREHEKMKFRVVIACGYGSGGISLLLDTLKGFIYEEIVRMNSGDILPVQEYFETKKQQYKDCELVFLPGYGTLRAAHDDQEPYDAEKMEQAGDPTMPGTVPYHKADFKCARHLYRKFGWPAASWRREEGLKAVLQFAERLHM